MIKAILIDDELDAIESLTWEINQFCKDIQIIDSFTNPEEAISAINYLGSMSFIMGKYKSIIFEYGKFRTNICFSLRVRRAMGNR